MSSSSYQNVFVPVWLALANALAEIVKIQRKFDNLFDSRLGFLRIKWMKLTSEMNESYSLVKSIHIVSLRVIPVLAR